MDYIFISYSRIDREYVSKIEEVLKKEHIKYFLDEKDIEWGGVITDSIEDNLANKVTHEIVVISPASIKSQWVSYEVGYAKASGVKILPFLTHPSIDLPLFLSGYNYITSIEQLEKYFAKDAIETKMLSIIKEDGTKEQVELLVCFEFNDTHNEYVVYTKNEYDKSGNITIYVSSVNRDTESGLPQMGEIPDEEWPRIKEVLNELAENDKSSIWSTVSMYDANGIEVL